MTAKSGTLARSTITATPTPTQIAGQTAAGRLAPMAAPAATSVIPAMIAPAALLRTADCRPCSLPPQWKKQPQAIKAAQIASAPPNGPRKSHVAMAPSTPTLIARAVFEDISPPFSARAGGCAESAGGPPAQMERKLFCYQGDSASAQSIVEDCAVLNT